MAALARKVAETFLNPFVAFARCAKRYDRLLPKEPTPQSFSAWLADLGEDLDPDDAASLWLDVCELAGWPESPILVGSGQPVISSIDRQPDLFVSPEDAINAAVADLAAVRRAAWGPEKAAKKFRGWLVSTGRAGTYSSAELRALYSSYCAEIKREESSENHMRKCLLKLRGVSKLVADAGGQRKGSRRERETKWTITQPLGK